MMYEDRSGSEARLGAILNELRTVNRNLRTLVACVETLSTNVEGVVEAIEEQQPRKH